MFIDNKLKYFIIILLFVFSCTKISQEKEENNVVVSDQESWNSTTFISTKGIKKAKIFSGHLLKYESSGNILLGDSVNVDFYNKQGKHVSILISDSGVVNETSQNLRAIGNVVLISDTGYTMYTDELIWYSDSEKVFTEGEIELFSAEDTLYGTGFTSDVKLKNWTITNPHGKTFRKLKENQ
ncbi:MAG: LPS export ABC transporter periplasmic protein LptC [Candidatus Marinimicrobia bacterium]|nr:LPS export ABC transporter periplasmic protein LptC [Candidatus Neomarinimicrobiota bacterium]